MYLFPLLFFFENRPNWPRVTQATLPKPNTSQTQYIPDAVHPRLPDAFEHFERLRLNRRHDAARNDGQRPRAVGCDPVGRRRTLLLLTIERERSGLDVPCGAKKTSPAAPRIACERDRGTGRRRTRSAARCGRGFTRTRAWSRRRRRLCTATRWRRRTRRTCDA